MVAAELGRIIRDFLGMRSGQFLPSGVFIENKELTLRKRYLKGAEMWSRNTLDWSNVRTSKGLARLARIERGQGTPSIKSESSCSREQELKREKELKRMRSQAPG